MTPIMPGIYNRPTRICISGYVENKILIIHPRFYKTFIFAVKFIGLSNIYDKPIGYAVIDIFLEGAFCSLVSHPFNISVHLGITSVHVQYSNIYS